MNILISASCLMLLPLIDKLIRSENRNSPPRKYMRETKLKSIVDEHKIPNIRMDSIMNFQHTPAFRFILLISGSDSSESESSNCISLAGMALLSLPSFECDIIFVCPKLKSSKAKGLAFGCQRTDVLFFLFDFR